MNKTVKMSVQAIQDFLNLCELGVEFSALSGEQQHIVEKFVAYCKPRGITIKSIPSPCRVAVFASTVKGKTNHIACNAILNGVRGWVINLDSDRQSKKHKTFKFYSVSEASCSPETEKYNAKVTKPLKEHAASVTL